MCKNYFKSIKGPSGENDLDIKMIYILVPCIVVICSY